MTSTTNHLIFWLPGWTATSNTTILQDGSTASLPADYIPTVEQFFRDENGTSLYNIYTQYCQGVPVGSTACPAGGQSNQNSATYGGALIDTDPYPGGLNCLPLLSSANCLSSGTIENVIRNAITSAGWSTGLNQAFYVFLAPGESTCNAGDCIGGPSSCAAEHDFFHTGLVGTGSEVIYAKMPTPPAGNCGHPQGPHSQQTDTVISEASHEQAEMITDPDGGGWWGSNANSDEIGDRCAGTAAFQHWNGHTYLVQLEWSNLSHACVAGEPNTEIKPPTANAVDTTLPACTANTLAANDDLSTSAVTLPFAVNFFGRTFTQLYVNNNGNVTFDGPLSTYTPFGLQGTSSEIIAPFFADADTRGPGSAVVTYGGAAASGGNPAYFCVNGLNVGYYASHTDLTNSFQLLLIDRSAQTGRPGDFDIVFNYNNIAWETGDASGGNGGQGGSSAHVGFSNGVSDSLELPGSGTPGAFLDGGPRALALGSFNSATAGRFIFPVRNGAAPTGGTVEGVVTDDSSFAHPVGGASVQVCGSTGACHLTSTSSAGNYSVPGLADASYTVTVFPPSGDGFAEGVAGPVTVAGGATVQANVILHSLLPLPRGTTLTHHSVNADGTLVLDWRVGGTLSTQGCVDGAGTVTIAGTNAFTHAPVTLQEALTETPSGSGQYAGTIPPLYPVAGPATFTVRFTCLHGSQAFSFTVYVDPSGQVVDQHGNPVAGATVTLVRSDGISGPFTQVPMGSTVMSPGNRTNPDTTGADGRFGWDVVVGYYEVQATKAGCTAPGNPAQDYVQTGPIQVPPPITDLRLTLFCPESDPAIAHVTGQTVSATEGSPFRMEIATFTDPDADASRREYAATVDWGDHSGIDSHTMITKDRHGVFHVHAEHVYVEEHSYTVNVTITDRDNTSNSATTRLTANISDAALASRCAADATSLQAFSGLTATLTDEDPNGMRSDYIATIDWGDGSSSPGLVTAGRDDRPYTVSGTHTYSSTGLFTIATAVRDVGGSQTIATCSTRVFALPHRREHHRHRERHGRQR